MPDYDAGFKIVARLAGKELAALAGVKCRHWQPIVGEVQAATRFADRAFLARGDVGRFVVYMEAYTRWQASAPWSILAKSGLLSERERLPTVSLLFILLPRGYRPQQGRFRLALGKKPTQQVWFREVCLWKLKPKRAWRKWPTLMPLYPLFDHQQSRREAIEYPVSTIIAEITDPVLRADLLTTLAIFGKLVYPGLNVMHLIGREQMKESKFYEEVMAEGAIEARRADIENVVKARFGPSESSDIARKLKNIGDADRLSEILILAAKCRDGTQLQREIDSLLVAQP